MDKSNRLLLAAGVLIFCFSAALTYLILDIQSMVEQREESLALVNSEAIPPPTFVWQEKYIVCQLYELDCEPQKIDGEQMREDVLAGLALVEIANRYPLPEWSVTEEKQQITLTKNLDGLCPKHKKIYHFGANASGEYLAVLYGPHQVGNSGGTYLLTDIAWQKISLEEREKIMQGEYEFYFQEDMIAALDSFSELNMKYE